MLPFLRRSAQSACPSVTEIAENVAAGRMVLIDVRDISELKASGKAKGALHVPLMLLQSRCDPKSPERLKGLSTDLPVVVYCASGGRSGMAAQALRKMGYAEVHNLGGLGDWHAGGGQVVPA